MTASPAFDILEIIVNLEEEGDGAESGSWPREAESVAVSAARAAFVAAAAPPPDARFEIGVTLADDATVRVLNRDHRGYDRPTNVLSFPLCALDDPPPEPGAALPLGDVILARETVTAEAALQGKALKDHLSHLVIHGVLHLLGFDHETDADAEIMEAQEVCILAGLGVADPYGGLPCPDASPPEDVDSNAASVSVSLSAPTAVSNRQ